MNSTRSRRVRVGGTLVALVAGLLAGPALAVSPAVAEEAAVPTVSVSKTAFLPGETAEITVTGTGFDPDMAKGTRPPLMGASAGTYVIFGKFADDWRPSQDVPSSARKVIEQKWAVPAESMLVIGGPAAGAIELEDDGTFSTTFEIDKAAADAATAGVEGNYGIYTFAGSGAKVAAYETYTPITFVPSTTTLTLPKSRAFGQATVATVRVASEGPAATGGTAELLQGGRVVASGEVTNGTARIAIPGRLTTGRAHTFTARYLGDSVVSPSDAAAGATVRITKAPSRVVAKVAKKRVKIGKRVRLNVRVGSPVKGVRPTAGTVRVKMRGFAKVVKINKAGKARVVLPARKKAGNFKVVVTYRGAANFTAARTTAVERVVR